MSGRPSVSLAMIVKNERHNLPRLLASIRGCFDAIHITDTGSDDGTVEYLRSPDAAATAGLPIQVHHFTWVHDFAAAREASFLPVTTDYVMWMDGDDVLSHAGEFVEFRDHVMSAADCWFVMYHYAFDAAGRPTLSVVRERALRMGRGFHWRYFVHEGCIQTEGQRTHADRVTSWTVNHLRTPQDQLQDRARNLRLFEQHGRTRGLEPRMIYYYGKELFDDRQYMEACVKLQEAVATERLEAHDLVMALQCAAVAALECSQHKKALLLATQGLAVVPTRAELWCLAGDAMVQQGAFHEALPHYAAARTCRPNELGGHLHCATPAYEAYPTEQIATTYLRFLDLDNARVEIERLKASNPRRAQELAAELERLDAVRPITQGASESGDLLFTCAPGVPPGFDDRTERERGLGGSETAVVELAEQLRCKTGRRVLIFNDRRATHVSPAGVIYRPSGELAEYLRSSRPLVQIAWRHVGKVSEAPTLVWSHDLLTPGADQPGTYDKLLCLSPFHRAYVKAVLRVPDERIAVMRNGIVARHFRELPQVKDPNKIVFASSPDRGLGHAIEVVARARKTLPELELHAFYGFENLRAFGHHAVADQLERTVAAHPWVRFHGNVTKPALARHLSDAGVWLYPADYLETFCITALDALACGCFPLVRRVGGLADTLAPLAQQGMAQLLDAGVASGDFDVWAHALVAAIKEKRWTAVRMDLERHDWSAVADEWIRRFDLGAVPHDEARAVG